MTTPNFKKKVYRNTQAFAVLAWASFGFFVLLMLIGLYTLKEPLMVKGYYLMGSLGLITSSFTVAKVIRDNQEDNEFYESVLASSASYQGQQPGARPYQQVPQQTPPQVGYPSGQSKA